MSVDYIGEFQALKAKQAPCKVNLTLDVFPPRPDGFHDLDSIVVQFLPGDEVISLCRWDSQPGIQLTCNDPSLPTDERNLAYRAAALFAERRKLGNVTVHISLVKRLPHQAGLGGGSSDAAAVLEALAERFPTKPSTLQKIAAEIGSDVPLFLESGPIRMRGRGEIVEPLKKASSGSQTVQTLRKYLHPSNLFGVIVKPHVGVSTGPAYKLLDEIPGRTPGNATEQLISVLQSDPVDLHAIAEAMSNDFEQAILPAFPEVAEAHRAVTHAGALRALLCGSGSAVFGLATDRKHAAAMAQTLWDSNRYAWVEAAESTL